jgi:histidinol-phosphatase
MLPSDDLRLAQRLGDAATAVAMEYYGRDVATRRKPDGSLVSDADLHTEDTLVALLRRHRPRDAILAEESGFHPGMSNRRWILDPVDGTSSFLAGGRAWGTHITLEVDGDLDVTVLTRPTEGLRWWAGRGTGAYAARQSDPFGTARRLVVSTTRSVDRARIGAIVEPGSPAAAALATRAQLVTDHICPLGALVEGHLDAVLDEGGRIWDQAPGALLVTEAGGLFRDPYGGRCLEHRWVLYCANPYLSDELTTLLLPYLPVPEGGDTP